MPHPRGGVRHPAPRTKGECHEAIDIACCITVRRTGLRGAAAAKKAKADETAKQAAELLVKAQDRAVQNYKRNQSTKSQ